MRQRLHPLFVVCEANLAGMDRAEAEAIYDSGREACVEFILKLAGRVEQREDRLRRLEQARQDSRTSSTPPSMDPPKTRAERRAEARAKAKDLMRREGERRKAGGQSGHRGAGRELKPEDQVDEIVDHYPDACGGCGRRFDHGQRRPGGRFGRHQVAELPPISVIVTEHRTHQLRCRGCRARTSAPLPELIAASPFGPRLRAAVVTLTARHRISRRAITELAHDLFGAWLSTGAVDGICQRASDALAGPHLQLQDWVLDQGAVHVDETGWRTSGEGRALWTATTPEALEPAPHCLGAFDQRVDVGQLALGELADPRTDVLAFGLRTGKLADLFERQSGALGDVDDRQAVQHGSAVAALAGDVLGCGQHADLLVVADVRCVQPGARGDLADRHPRRSVAIGRSVAVEGRAHGRLLDFKSS